MPKLSLLVIGGNCSNYSNRDLEICNLPELKTIVLRQNSLQYVNSLHIRNNKKLKTIKLERKPDAPFYTENTVLANAKDIVLDSIFTKSFIIIRSQISSILCY